MRAYDPEAMEAAGAILSGESGVEFCEDPYSTLDSSDALAIVTEWKAFRSPDFARIKSTLNEPIIFDGRNLYDPGAVSTTGIEYHAIGRPVAHPNK